MKVAQSCPTLRPHGLYSPWNSPGHNTGVGSLSPLQGIFLTQGLNPGLPRCRQILYQLSHKGSPRILLEGQRKEQKEEKSCKEDDEDNTEMGAVRRVGSMWLE